MSGVYSLNVNINTSVYLDRGEISVVFTCKPMKESSRAYKRLQKKLLIMLQMVKIVDETISYLKKSYRTNYEREYKKNSYFNEYFSNIILEKEQTISQMSMIKWFLKITFLNIKNIYGDYETTFYHCEVKKQRSKNVRNRLIY